MSKIKLTKKNITANCKIALNEDLTPSGDITSKLIKKNLIGKAKLISNSNGILGGIGFVEVTFKLLNKNINFISKKKEGSKIKKGEIIGIIKGNLQSILKGERVALNFLSHISGIATITNKFVNSVNRKTKICCTRKTIPGLRIIQKYAVKLGGGINHRFNLSDEILIKDNHISTMDIRQLVEKSIKENNGKKITVEIDKLNQLKKIIGLKFNTVLFDNMSLRNLRKGVQLANKYYETEASGNINFLNVKSIASTGVNRISIGSLTHTIKPLDFKIEF